MPTHLFNLVGRSFSAIPPTLGSTWFGLLFPIVVVLIGEIIVCFIFGWRRMLENWRKATGIGFVAVVVGYILVFTWRVLMTAYQDHVGLANRIGVLHKKVDADASHEQMAVSSVRTDLGDQLSGLRQTCAKTEGANGVLTKQTADQQNTINNCQSQAIKLLTPEALKISPYLMDFGGGSGTTKVALYLVLTNKTITPVVGVLSCDKQAKVLTGGMLGAGGGMGGGGPISKETPKYRFIISYVRTSSPAWVPSTPMYWELAYVGPETINCDYQED